MKINIIGFRCSLSYLSEPYIKHSAYKRDTKKHQQHQYNTRSNLGGAPVVPPPGSATATLNLRHGLQEDSL